MLALASNWQETPLKAQLLLIIVIVFGMSQNEKLSRATFAFFLDLNDELCSEHLLVLRNKRDATANLEQRQNRDENCCASQETGKGKWKLVTASLQTRALYEMLMRFPGDFFHSHVVWLVPTCAPIF